jgi:hypothetical protein
MSLDDAFYGPPRIRGYDLDLQIGIALVGDLAAQGRHVTVEQRHCRPSWLILGGRAAAGQARGSSTSPANSPCGSTADSTTSASAEPTPEPPCCLIHNLDVRIINTATGELTINPDRDYQPTGKTRYPPPKQMTPNPPSGVQGHSDLLRDHMVEVVGRYSKLPALRLLLPSRPHSPRPASAEPGSMLSTAG